MEHLKKENTSIVTGQEELERYLTFGCLFINCLCSVLLLHLVKCILIFFSFIMNHHVFWVFSVERKGCPWTGGCRTPSLSCLVVQTFKFDPHRHGEVLKELTWKVMA